MANFINRAALNKTTFSSSGVGILSYTLHCITKPARYRGTVLDDGRQVANFTIECDEKCTDNFQADVDLALLAGPQASTTKPTYQLRPGGFLLLFDSRYDRNYQVRLHEIGSEQKSRSIFDTKTLGKGDAYAMSLLRPGEYGGYNTKNKTEFCLSVLYPPTVSAKKQPDVSQLAPLEIAVSEKGFHPNSADVLPGQGIVFRIATPSQIELKLTKAAPEPKRLEATQSTKQAATPLKKKGEIRHTVQWRRAPKAK